MIFKEGDIILKIKDNCCSAKEGKEYKVILDTTDDKDGILAVGDSLTSLCHCQSEWELITNKNKTNNIMMTNIKNFVKNLTLTSDEKLLRKHGLKNDCGEYTQEAIDVIINKLVKDNEVDLITLAKEIEKEEANNK